MCGRFTLTAPPDVLSELLGLDPGWVSTIGVASWRPRYNIAPGQNVVAARVRDGEGSREPALLRWGLVPSWAKDPKIGNRLINARSETAAEKPSFRTAFSRRRCLVPADGFYEWQRSGKTKQPFCIRLVDDRPFAFAGLWEHWQDPAGIELESCTLLTTTANDLLAPIHDRMPVILRPADYQRWLDPVLQKVDPLLPLMAPFPASEMRAYPVSDSVNSSTHDDPRCMEPRRSI
jgi:putative SOS response-associated peptidase YedK